MNYQASYDVAKARRYHFPLNELMSLCNAVLDIRSGRGRPIEFPLPTLFVLLGLKFDSGLGYRDSVAQVNFNPSLLERLSFDRTPNRSLLHGALIRLDTGLLHRMYELLARKKPPPTSVVVDSTGFSHSTDGEWISVRCQKTRKRRFHALHNAVDVGTLMINGSRVRARPGGDVSCMVALLRRGSHRELETVYGDKAYISRRNVQYIHDLGVYPAIEPKKRSRAYSQGHRAYGQLVRECQESAEEGKRTQEYGRRSLAETVFSMMKLRSGGGLSSRGHREQRRELLLKLVLHNIKRLNFLECAGR